MAKWAACVLVLLLALMSGHPVDAHEGGLVVPADVWEHWNADPLIAAGLFGSACLYWRGAAHLWRRAGIGHGISRSGVAAFSAGLGVLFIALVTPLHPLGETLFTAHMIQHLLIMVIAAPLLALGSPVFVILWGLPIGWRRIVSRWWSGPVLRTMTYVLTAPLVGWALHVIVMWCWHLPVLYEGAVTYEALHALEHSLFLGTGLLYWGGIVRAKRVQAGFNVISLFALMMATGLLGALLSLAGSAWYPTHSARAPFWGLTPLEDQQIAGGIMWIPMSLVYLVAAALQITLLLEEKPYNREKESTTHAMP